MKEHRPEAIREATGAFCRSLLDAMLPAIREVARHHGYAVAVHGSLSRDIDLIAVAWVEIASQPDELVKAICGAVSGIAGRCHILGKANQEESFSRKPHGRIAYTLVHDGFIGEIDISIIPPSAVPAV